MPDYSQLLRQKISEKDAAVQQSSPSTPAPDQSMNQLPRIPEDQQTPIPQSAEELRPGQRQGVEREMQEELFRQQMNPGYENPIEPIPENPYTWTPEYTQRGFVEEVGTSLMRGFGTHVVGSTGNMLQLINGLIPGWEIREGNMLSRYLQDVGKEFEEEYQVYMPEEIKDNEFTLNQFMNPDFWSKTLAEYIPQLVEMVLISRGAGGLAKKAAKDAVEGIGKGMTKEALEKVGQKVVTNTSERVLGGVAKTANKVGGQAKNKDWRSMFITSSGEATQGLGMGAEMIGGGLSMNLIAGLQNAGQLVTELGKEKDPDTGKFLYTEQQLAQMASGTMVEVMKYLPVDMVSYGITYGRTAGHFNKMLNPFNKKSKKPFFSQTEQLVATSKSFTQEISPIMQVLKATESRVNRSLGRARNIGSAVSKPLFEGVEEQFQESWEEWATKKARARVTGEPLTIDGVENDSAFDYVGDYWSFFKSKENEATRTIAMGLGVLGGGASQIIGQINKKAENQFKNYSKTELLKHAAANSKAYDLQTAFIKEQLVDNAIDGNVNNEAYIADLIDNGVIAPESKSEWTAIGNMLVEEAKKAKAIGNLNVSGQIAYLENKLRVLVAEQGYAFEEKKKNEAIAVYKEELKSDPKLLAKKIALAEDAWLTTEEGFIQQIAIANQGVLRILSGQKADVANIKHVQDENGNTVAVALSEVDFNDWYNRSDEQVYAAARTKRFNPKPKLDKLGNIIKPKAEQSGNAIKNFYNQAAEKLSAFKAARAEKAKVKKEAEEKTKAEKENKTNETNETALSVSEEINNIIQSPKISKTIDEFTNTNLDREGKENLLTDDIKDIVDNWGIDEKSVSDYMKQQGTTLVKAVWRNNKDEFFNILKNWEEGKKLKEKEKAGTKSGQGRAFMNKNVDDILDENTLLSKEEKAELERLKKEPVVKSEPRKDTELDEAIKETFTEDKPTNLETAEKEMLDELKKAKVDPKNKVEAQKIIDELVAKQEGRIGMVARRDNVTSEQLAKYLTDLITNANAPKPKVESKESRQKKIDKIEAEKAARLKRRKEMPEYQNAAQIQYAQEYNDEHVAKQIKKVIKNDPTSRKILQEEYDAYLSSTIARAKLGPSVITNQIAINQHLRRLFPDSKIQAYAMSNLYQSIGENAIGYAIGTSIMIDEKVWNQDEVFMHEFLHIHYALTKNEPATKAIIKEAAKDKKKLDELYKTYASQTIWAYPQVGWKPGMEKAKGMLGQMTKREQNRLLRLQQKKNKDGTDVAYRLPLQEQPVILDELFVDYMVGPMVKGFDKFFTPQSDLKNQIQRKNWWKWLKSKAVGHQEEYIDVLKALNEGKDVPVTNLKNHIMSNFVSSIKGKQVNVRGRMALSNDETLIIHDKHEDIRKRIKEEQNNITEEVFIEELTKAENAFIEEQNKAEIAFMEELTNDRNQDLTQEVEDDYDYWNSPEEVMDADLFETENEILSEQNDSVEMDLGTFWDKGFDATNLKNRKIITYFVDQYNRRFNEARSKRLKQLEEAPPTNDQSKYAGQGNVVDAVFIDSLNESKFTENLIDIAKQYDSHIDFIRVLEDSKMKEHQEFVKHLNKISKTPLQRLQTMHYLYANSEILPAIIHDTSKNGVYSTFIAHSAQDPSTVKKVLEKIKAADSETQQKVRDAINAIFQSTQSTKFTDEYVATIIKFYGNDMNITAKILNDGYLIIGKRNMPLFSAIKHLVDAGLGQGLLSRNAEPAIKAILNTGKQFSSTSTFINATGKQGSNRMFSNHAIKLFNKMVNDLKTKENTPKNKKEFLSYYTNSKGTINNPLLESYWNNYHERGEVPMLALDAGSRNAMYDRSKDYKNASAEQHLINEMLQFQEVEELNEIHLQDKLRIINSNKDKSEVQKIREEKEAIEAHEKNKNSNYLGSMDILGDSSRRVLLAMPKIKNITNPDGTFNHEHVARMYEVYNNLSLDKKRLMAGQKQKTPADHALFVKSLNKAVAYWESYMQENQLSFSKIKSLEKLYDGKNINQEGKKIIKEFVFNRIANTFYVHQILSPGLSLDSLTKVFKGQIAPVINLDPNLKVEMIPMAREYKTPRPLKESFKNDSKLGYDKVAHDEAVNKWKSKRILSNDGIQYILEKHALAIQRLMPELGRGYKLYNHHIEKNNPHFMNETSQMKGYTTILTDEEVNGKWVKDEKGNMVFQQGSQAHLKPMYDLLMQRDKKFTDWYGKTYGVTDENGKLTPAVYDENFRTQTSIDENLLKYIPIVVPIDSDKTSLFSIDELSALQDNYTLEQLKNPIVMKEYQDLLDGIYYSGKDNDIGFNGLDGSNFGPQQIMDKRYKQATLSIQAVVSPMFGQEGVDFVRAIQTQQYIVDQKMLNLKTKVLDKIDENDDASYSQLIINTANELDSDPYTIRALIAGAKSYSPHVASFALNQFRALMIRHGNNLAVPGTYGQTISDMGYKYTSNESGQEVFINKPNRFRVFPKVKEEYINGSSGLNFYGIKQYDREINGKFVKTKTIPFEIVLPKQEAGDKTISRQSFYDKNDGGLTKARNYLTEKVKGKYKQLVTLRRLQLVDANDQINEFALEELLNENKIYSSKESIDANVIGTYIPGETVILTRIPHNGPAFVGVAEVVGFHSTGASNIIVPSEYTAIIGSDHDGDALFIYKHAKLKNGEIDTRTDKGYGNWNMALDNLVEQWLSQNMRETLTTQLNFEDSVQENIEKMDRAFKPEQAKKIDALKEQLNNKIISQEQFDKSVSKIIGEDEFIMPFSPEHYTKQYNNSVIAKQTVGVAFNMHRAINMLAAYKTELMNDWTVNNEGKEIPNKASITINGRTFDKFEDALRPGRTGQNSRIHQSTILANIILDSTKNGHADAMNINLNSVAGQMILVNLGFTLEEIGFLYNHPMAKEYIKRRNNINNDFIDTGGYGKMLLDYSKDENYGKELNIYSSPNSFNIDARPVLENGKHNPYFNSKDNNMQVVRLLNYLSKISEDISTLTNVTNGHKTLENNPFFLEKKIKDLSDLLNNDKRDSFDPTNKKQTLYFEPNTSEKSKLKNNPEVKHYKEIALLYAKHQKRLNIINNKSIANVLELVKQNITFEELSGNQLTHYSDKITPFVYAHLLSLNNLEVSEINEIFDVAYDYNGNPVLNLKLVDELNEYQDMLDEIIYYKNPNNYLEVDTALTRSKIFKRGILFDKGEIKINPEVLQKYYLKEDITEIQQDFLELPLYLQRQLIIYDLIVNGFKGEKSIYPILSYDITSYIDNQATAFQNKGTSSKFDTEIITKIYKRILDIETINPDNNHLPKIYLDKALPDFSLPPGDRTYTEIYAKLGDNKKVRKKLFETESTPFRVTINYVQDGKQKAQVFQVNPISEEQKRKHDMREGVNRAIDKKISQAKAYNNWTSLEKALITTVTENGHVLIEPAMGKTNLVDISQVLTKLIPNVNMIMIEDANNTPLKVDGEIVLPILDKKLVEKEKAEHKETIEKKNNSSGRFLKRDYHHYTSDIALTKEQFIDAYEFKRNIPEIKINQLWNQYNIDKDYANEQKHNYVDFEGNLLKVNPETNEAFTDQELVEIYQRWGKKDAYAVANILVPVMLELIQRNSNHQSQVITKVMEGDKDIGVIQAWFQTNNIDSTHPATQSIQRDIEIEFKGFQNERKKYMERINKVTEALYAEKLNYNPVRSGFLKKLQFAARVLFTNRSDLYLQLYGNILKKAPRKSADQLQKRYQLLTESELKEKLNNNQISQAEYDFAETFREITNELDPGRNPEERLNGGIPNLGPGRLEAFGRKGLLGVLTTSRPIEQGIYDVQMNYNGEVLDFKQIEDIFRQDLDSNWKNNIAYLRYRRKADKLYKTGKNEDGTIFKHSKVFNHTMLGDGMVNNFTNGGWSNENDFLSMDLARVLSDFTHTQLFIEGNKNFDGFKKLQVKVDGLLIHNQLKGFTNQNNFVQKVYKEYFLKGTKLDKQTQKDKVIDAFVKGNLLYVMGWKLMVLGKGIFVVGNVLIGKYNNIKNQGGKAWIEGEKRFWGVDQNGSKHRKAMGVLKTLNFQDISLYDNVNIQKSAGIDSIFADLALLPMTASENWIQGVHFLGMLTEEQWQRFDDNGDYKINSEHIPASEIVKIENTVKSSHGKGYTTTDQRMIQRYSWGRAIMQFSRFIPTMFYDRFAKEDINIYGEKHIGSLRALYVPIAKAVSGDMTIEEIKNYRNNLDVETRARFDSGLKGLAMVSVALLAGSVFDIEPARELAGDANYLINEDKLAYKAVPPVVRTIKNMTEDILGL